MAKCFISFGIINKKMLFPLIYIIISSLINIYGLNKENKEVFKFMSDFESILGELSSFFVGQIIKYRSITEKKNKNSKKQLILDFFFFFLINSFFMLIRYIPLFFMNIGKEVENDKYKDLLIIDAL